VSQPVHLFDRDTAERVRDLADERYAATGGADWSTLVEVCEEMIAGIRPESEPSACVSQHDLWGALGMEPPP
jgi:hypothetical protein